MSEALKLRPVRDGVAHIHASCISVDGKALLLAGPSRSGKSSLALEMMALGAGLIADDVTEMVAGPPLIARAPPTLPHAIEARGLGILSVELAEPAEIVAALDLSRRSAERLPEKRTVALMGAEVPLLHKPVSGPVAAMLLQYLKQKHI